VLGFSHSAWFIPAPLQHPRQEIVGFFFSLPYIFRRKWNPLSKCVVYSFPAYKTPSRIRVVPLGSCLGVFSLPLMTIFFRGLFSLLLHVITCLSYFWSEEVGLAFTRFVFSSERTFFFPPFAGCLRSYLVLDKPFCRFPPIFRPGIRLSPYVNPSLFVYLEQFRRFLSAKRFALPPEGSERNLDAVLHESAPPPFVPYDCESHALLRKS